MTVRLSFKTPDVMDQIPDDNEQIREFIRKFVQYSEYVTIEFDDVAKTATVIPVH